MKIVTKFNIGDKVAVPATQRKKMSCVFCNGEGFRVVDDSKIYCENCQGTGELYSMSEKIVITPGIITGMTIDAHDDKSIGSSEDSGYHRIGNIYLSLEYEVKTLRDDVVSFGTYQESQLKKLKETKIGN